MEKIQIESGQYWLLVDGSLVTVLGNSPFSKKYWIVNKMYPNGMLISRIPVEDSNFKKEIDIDDARQLLDVLHTDKKNIFLNVQKAG